MSNTSVAKTSSSGISFGGMLAILFIGLKLTGYIDWSWWWVLSPLWLPIAAILVFMAIAALVYGVVTLASGRKS